MLEELSNPYGQVVCKHCDNHYMVYGCELLAIEMKRKGNKKNVDKDKERLASLVSPFTRESLDDCVHDTLLGAFIVYCLKGADIELFYYSHKEARVITESRQFVWDI